MNINSPDSNLINLLTTEHFNQQNYFKMDDFSNSQQFIPNLSSSSSTSSNCSYNGDSINLNQQQQLLYNQQQNGNFKLKKPNKKKSMMANEVDEERTSQLVSEILKNIKEKTKELENMNQTTKCTVSQTKQQSTQQASVASPMDDTDESMIQAPQQKKIKRINKNLKAPKLNPNVLNFSNQSNNFSNNNEHINNSQEGEKSQIVLVPYLWKRLKDENGLIYYISPSGIQLKSITDIYKYLTSNNTCKCGLQCPLDLKQTFNFDPQFESSQILEPPPITQNKKCCQIEHQDDQPKQQLKRKKIQTKKASNNSPSTVKKKRTSSKINKINDSFDYDISSEHEIEQQETVYSSQTIQQQYTESDKLVNTNLFNNDFNVIANDPMFNANNEKKGY